MALQRDTRYPGRWTVGNAAHPQGAFKNRTAPGSLDGSYIEQDWANDWDGFFSSLLAAAGVTANGTVDAVGASQYFSALAAIAGHGQCRLSVGSTTTLLLKPYNGNNVIVNGVPLRLPSAGVTYTASGLTASTLYYVYLSGTTVAPVLALSTTGHSTAPNGVETKTGDVTQTLVGMVYTNASTQFVDSLTSRTCLNWFNRRNLPSTIFSSTAYSFTSTTPVEASTALRNTFLTWADDGVDVSVAGDMSTTASAILAMLLYVDGVIAGPVQAQSLQGPSNFAAYFSRTAGFYSEGLHTASLFVNVVLGTTTGSVQHCQNNVIIRG